MAADTATPLARTLGLQRGMRVLFCHLPDDVRALLAPEQLGIEELAAPSAGIEAAHIFVDDAALLARELAALVQLITPGAFIWVSFAPDSEQLDGDAVRTAALPLELVAAAETTLTPEWQAIQLVQKGRQ